MKSFFRFAPTAALVLRSLFPAVSGAAVIPVTQTGDSGEGSLRSAIEAVNAAGGQGDIDLGSLTGAIVLASPLPDVRAHVRLLGPAHGGLRLDGQGRWPLLAFASGTTGEVHRLILTNALATGYRHGAAISNAGVLLLQHCRLEGNENQFGWGGAIFNRGHLEVLECALVSNRARGEPGDGAGLDGPGGGGAGLGGAIFHEAGTLLASNCVFVGNTAFGGDGGPNGNGNFGPNTNPGSGRGGGPEGGYPGVGGAGGGFGSGGGGGGVSSSGAGGIGGGDGGGTVLGAQGGSGMGGAFFARSGSVVLVRCRFEQNRVRGGYGNYAALVGGPGGHGFGGAGLVLDADVQVNQCEFIENRVEGANPGGVTDFLFGGGTGPGGISEGAALSVWGGQLRLIRSYLHANSALGGGGGGAKSGSAGGPGRGGAIAVRHGKVEVRRSLLMANRAAGGAGGAARSTGDGGEAVGGAVACLGGEVLVENCTLAANTALGGDVPEGMLGTGVPGLSAGGAIGVRALSTRSVDTPIADVRFSTLSSNACVQASTLFFFGTVARPGGVVSGGGADNAGGVLRMGGVICAGNLSPTNTDLGGVVESLRANLVRSPGSAQGLSPHDLIDLDPMLSALADHGGDWPTFALEAGSPAIDRLPGQDGPDEDQRGSPRPVGVGWDLGAYERSEPTDIGPRIAAVRHGQGGRSLVFGVEGQAGALYRVEASADLETWTPVGTVMTGGTFEEPVEAGYRYYRLARQVEQGSLPAAPHASLGNTHGLRRSRSR